MDTIQKAVDSILYDLLRPEKMIAKLIEKKLQSIGITLTNEQRESFKAKLEDLQGDSVTLEFEFDDDQLRDVNIPIEDIQDTISIRALC